MKRPLFAGAFILTVLMWIWLLSGGGAASPDTQDIPSPVVGETVVLTGKVIAKDEGSFSINSVILYQINQVAAESQPGISYEEQFICEISDAGTVPLGSAVAVQGVFAPFSRAENPGEFDSEAYYRSIRVCGKLRQAEVLNIEPPGIPLQEMLYRLRCLGKERLYEIFPAKQASVMCALLLGDREDLDAETEALYRENGILHILSISSLHITILGMSLYGLLRRIGLPVWLSSLIGAVIILLYGAMTGFGVSACRAVIMYLLRMLAQVVGRTYDVLNALGAAGIGMLCCNPWYLTNCGFLLSFASVLGIGVVYRMLLQIRGERVSPVLYGESRMRAAVRTFRRKLEEQMLLGLSVTLMTLPIQLWYFYEVPLHSVFINLFVIPFANALLISGIAALLLPFGEIIGYLDRVILLWYETVCGWFDGIAFLHWNPGKPSVWQMVLYYVLMGGILLWGARKKGERRGGTKIGSPRYRIVLVGMLLAVAVFAIRPLQRASVTFLSVGQGDCSIVRTASGETYLFDCGSTSRSKVGEYVLLPFLKYYGIRTLDAVIVSHADEDHVSGIYELLALGEENHITVKQLVVPDIGAESREEFEELWKAAGQQRGNDGQGTTGIAIRYLAAGENWDCGDAQFQCLHPKAGGNGADSNEDSLCIYAVFGEVEQPDFTVLFTGDVGGDGEKALTEAMRTYGIKDISILKVAHHGSRYSTSEEFLRVANPRVAVISCGKNNWYGHPHAETLERLDAAGCEVLTTPEYGAITVEAGKEIMVYGFVK